MRRVHWKAVGWSNSAGERGGGGGGRKRRVTHTRAPQRRGVGGGVGKRKGVSGTRVGVVGFWMGQVVARALGGWENGGGACSVRAARQRARLLGRGEGLEVHPGGSSVQGGGTMVVVGGGGARGAWSRRSARGPHGGAGGELERRVGVGARLGSRRLSVSPPRHMLTKHLGSLGECHGLAGSRIHPRIHARAQRGAAGAHVLGGAGDDGHAAPPGRRLKAADRGGGAAAVHDGHAHVLLGEGEGWVGERWVGGRGEGGGKRRSRGPLGAGRQASARARVCGPRRYAHHQHQIDRLMRLEGLQSVAPILCLHHRQAQLEEGGGGGGAGGHAWRV